MRSLLLALLLVTPAALAQTSWDSLDAGGNRVQVSHAGTADGMAAFWVLVDYKRARVTGDGGRYRSRSMLVQIDCAERRSRELHRSLYAEHGKRGAIIDIVTGEGEWRALPADPDPLQKAILEVGCR